MTTSDTIENIYHPHVGTMALIAISSNLRRSPQIRQRDGRLPWRRLAPSLLLIAAGNKSWFNRVVLSHRLFVWLGLISFPLYLWHWPLLVFARIVERGTPSAQPSTLPAPAPV